MALRNHPLAEREALHQQLRATASDSPECASAARPSSQLRRLLGFIALQLGICALLYGTLYAIYLRFPYLQAGADLVTQKKHDIARTGRPFRQSGVRRIAAFGDSRILSGFIPARFDHDSSVRSGLQVESYNFGLPGDSRFLRDLETMISRGAAPDVVLLTFPWPETPEAPVSLLRYLDRDQDIMSALFPFRRLPRDFMIMAVTTQGVPSRFAAAYQNNERSLQQVEADRGYYFLARMSHFQGDELPAGLRLQTDQPAVVNTRRVVASGPVYHRLVELFAAHHIRCLLIPTYYREYEYAVPPPVNPVTASALAHSRQFQVLGPDYYLFPNSYFSDPRHLNRHGAEAYTHLLAELLAPALAAPLP